MEYVSRHPGDNLSLPSALDLKGPNKCPQGDAEPHLQHTTQVTGMQGVVTRQHTQEPGRVTHLTMKASWLAFTFSSLPPQAFSADACSARPYENVRTQGLRSSAITHEELSDVWRFGMQQSSAPNLPNLSVMVHASPWLFHCISQQ